MEETKHIVANDYSLINRFYTLKGNDYEVIATRTTDWQAKNAIDRIRRLDTGDVKEISRIKLFEYTR